jgi:hypothetical protein
LIVKVSRRSGDQHHRIRVFVRYRETQATTIAIFSSIWRERPLKGDLPRGFIFVVSCILSISVVRPTQQYTRVCGIYRCSVTTSATCGVYASHPIFATRVKTQIGWIRLNQNQWPTEDHSDGGAQARRMPQTQVAALTMVHRVAATRPGPSPLCRR